MSGGARAGRASRRRDGRKSTQRDRLVAAMIDAAGGKGYGTATIAHVVARAGVSRPTFYDYFAAREECLLAAIDEAQEHLLARVRKALSTQGGEQSLGATTASVVEFARCEPAMARLVMCEAAAGGPRALELRDRGLDEIALAVEEGYEGVAPGASCPDACPRIVAGGLYRLLARRLRQGETLSSELTPLLRLWISSYERPLGAHRWRALTPIRALRPTAPTRPLLRPPDPSPRGSRKAAADAAHQRERILFAAADIACEQGYAGATVAAITRRAGVNQRAFRRAFAHEQDVIGELHERFFLHLMTVTAGAFFSPASWPERVWRGSVAAAQSGEENPTLAHVAFVEGYAAGPAAAQRIDGLVEAFTIFLEQGYEMLPGSSAAPPSRVALEAIAWASHELAHVGWRAAERPQLLAHAPHVAFLALAPFLGSAPAEEFIDGKLGARELDTGA